jgi:hypothetical protein
MVDTKDTVQSSDRYKSFASANWTGGCVGLTIGIGAVSVSNVSAPIKNHISVLLV